LITSKRCTKKKTGKRDQQASSSPGPILAHIEKQQQQQQAKEKNKTRYHETRKSFFFKLGKLYVLATDENVRSFLDDQTAYK
jgi:hypothetical protein